jgi:hypothetical protein
MIDTRTYNEYDCTRKWYKESTITIQYNYLYVSLHNTSAKKTFKSLRSLSLKQSACRS